MINFKTFLTEQSESTWGINENNSKVIDDLVERIKSDCSKFFDNPSRPLYRGSRSRDKYSALIEEPRKDRMPLDSPLFLHKMIDDVTYEKVGYRLRSQSVFCTPALSRSRGYGPSHVIIPIGDFKIFYSIKEDGEPVYDLYYVITTIMGHLKIDNNFKNKNSLAQEYTDAVLDVMKKVVIKENLHDSELLIPTLTHLVNNFIQDLDHDLTGTSQSSSFTEENLDKIIEDTLKNTLTVESKWLEKDGEKLINQKIDFQKASKIIKSGFLKSLKEVLKTVEWKSDNNFSDISELNIVCDKYYLIKLNSYLGKQVLSKLPFEHVDKWIKEIRSGGNHENV